MVIKFDTISFNNRRFFYFPLSTFNQLNYVKLQSEGHTFTLALMYGSGILMLLHLIFIVHKVNRYLISRLKQSAWSI